MKQLAALMVMFLGGVMAGAVAAAPTNAGQQCVECHEAESKPHAYHGDCVSCHTGTEEHARDESPASVKVTGPNTQQCQACHGRDSKRMNFTFAEHNRAGIQCSDCHGMHSPKVKSLRAGMERAGKETALCAACHQDVITRFNMRSHHPVREGGMSCVDCHDPHSGKQLTLAAKTTQCTQCHQNVRGPHAFEHAPAAEDCTTCHNPHGSPNSKMLSLAQPMLCLQCHSVAGNRHGAAGTGTNNQLISATALRNCSSCHSAPHGSHMDQHLRF